MGERVRLGRPWDLPGLGDERRWRSRSQVRETFKRLGRTWTGGRGRGGEGSKVESERREVPLRLVVDASVVSHGLKERPIPSCAAVVKLIEQGRVELCVTGAIEKEWQDLPELAEKSGEGISRKRLRRLLRLARRVDRESSVWVDSIEGDDADTCYWEAWRKVRIDEGQQKWLLSRDDHLLNSHRAVSSGRVIHPAEFVQLPQVRRLIGGRG